MNGRAQGGDEEDFHLYDPSTQYLIKWNSQTLSVLDAVNLKVLVVEQYSCLNRKIKSVFCTRDYLVVCYQHLNSSFRVQFRGINVKDGKSDILKYEENEIPNNLTAVTQISLNKLLLVTSRWQIFTKTKGDYVRLYFDLSERDLRSSGKIIKMLQSVNNSIIALIDNGRMIEIRSNASTRPYEVLWRDLLEKHIDDPGDYNVLDIHLADLKNDSESFFMINATQECVYLYTINLASLLRGEFKNGIRTELHRSKNIDVEEFRKFITMKDIKIFESRNKSTGAEGVLVVNSYPFGKERIAFRIFLDKNEIFERFLEDSSDPQVPKQFQNLIRRRGEKLTITAFEFTKNQMKPLSFIIDISDGYDLLLHPRKFDLYNEEFMLNVEFHEEIISKWTLESSRGDLLRQLEEMSENYEDVLSHYFLEYVIEKGYQQYLIDLILATCYDKGQRKYVILGLEKVQEVVFALFSEKTKTYKEDKLCMREDNMNSIYKFVVGVRQIYQAILRRKNEEAYANIKENNLEQFLKEEEEIIIVIEEELSIIEKTEYELKLLIWIYENQIIPKTESFQSSLSLTLEIKKKAYEDVLNNFIRKYSINSTSKQLLLPKEPCFLKLLTKEAGFPLSPENLRKFIKDSSTLETKIYIYYLLYLLQSKEGEELLKKFNKDFLIENNIEYPICSGFVILDNFSAKSGINSTTLSNEYCDAKTACFYLSQNVDYPEAWKLHTLRIFSITSNINEMFLFAKTSGINWSDKENAKLLITLYIIHGGDPLQAYMMVNSQPSLEESGCSRRELFEFFLEICLEQGLASEIFKNHYQEEEKEIVESFLLSKRDSKKQGANFLLLVLFKFLQRNETEAISLLNSLEERDPVRQDPMYTAIEAIVRNIRSRLPEELEKSLNTKCSKKYYSQSQSPAEDIMLIEEKCISSGMENLSEDKIIKNNLLRECMGLSSISKKDLALNEKSPRHDIIPEEPRSAKPNRMLLPGSELKSPRGPSEFQTASKSKRSRKYHKPIRSERKIVTRSMSKSEKALKN